MALCSRRLHRCNSYLLNTSLCQLAQQFRRQTCPNGGSGHYCSQKLPFRICRMFFPRRQFGSQELSQHTQREVCTTETVEVTLHFRQKPDSIGSCADVGHSNRKLPIRKKTGVVCQRWGDLQRTQGRGRGRGRLTSLRRFSK